MDADRGRADSPTAQPDDHYLARAVQQDVPALLRAIAGSAVEEIQLERSGVRLSLRRVFQETLPGTAAAGSGTPGLVASPASDLATQPAVVEVLSAHVGIFHRSREPGGPLVAEVGARVETGGAIGVVETLGMSADVEAPVAGRLVEIRAEDGQPVEYGQALAVIQAD